MVEDIKAKLQTTYEFFEYSIDALNGRTPREVFMGYITGERREKDFAFHERIEDHGVFLEDDVDKDPYKDLTHEHRIEHIWYRQTKSDKPLGLTWREFVKLGRPKTIIKTLEGQF